MRVRVKFEKTGAMQYVGHLDLMRFFQKAVKRAELKIKYSEGFNPHQIMAFALPLGVGITSEGEYMDIEINEEISSKDAIKRLNDNMVDGLYIKSFKYLSDNATKAMSAVTASHYIVTYKDSQNDITYIDNLLDLKKLFFDDAASIMIVKETKKGTRELDLKPLVYRFDISFNGKVPVYDIMISSGSVDNIKPELLIKAFHEFIGDLEEPSVMNLFIKRVDMYTGEPNEFISLGDIGDER